MFKNCFGEGRSGMLESIVGTDIAIGTLSQEIVMLYVLLFFFFTTGMFLGLYISRLKLR
jgi:hypothetical protein